MSTIPFLLVAWMIHAVVAVVVVSPVVFLARKRVHWHSLELLAVVVPFCAWGGLMCSDLSTGSKTLSNFVIEPCILALALPFGALARVAMTASMAETKASIVVLAGLCLSAAGIFWIIPVLPE